MVILKNFAQTEHLKCKKNEVFLKTCRILLAF